MTFFSSAIWTQQQKREKDKTLKENSLLLRREHITLPATIAAIHTTAAITTIIITRRMSRSA